MAELLDEYEKNHNGKKASTQKSDASRIVMHIRPKLGKLRVASVTQADMEAFMLSLSPGSEAQRSETTKALGCIRVRSTMERAPK